LIRSRGVRVGLIVAAGLAGLILLAVLSAWTAVSLIIASGTIVAAALPIAMRFRAGAFDVLEPIVGGSVALAVIFGIRPIAMLLNGDFIYRDVDIRPEFPFVIALGLVGSLAFVGMYELVRTSRSDSADVEEVSEHRLEPTIIYVYITILAVLSVALFGVHLARLGSDFADGLRLFLAGTSPDLIARWAGTTEYLSASPILATCAATLLGVATRWRLKRYQLALVVALVSYPLLVFYVSGDRRFMIPAIGVPIVAWMLMTGRRPGRRVSLLAIPMAFAVLTAIPFVRWAAARQDAGGLTGALVQGLGDPMRAVDRFILGPDTSMFSALAIEIRVLRTPQDFFYGRATVGDLLLAPIPHLLISDKPRTARDELLIRAYGTPCSLTGGGVCDDFSIIGTSYQDFWVPGVAIVMAVIGAATAALWSRWRRSSGNPWLTVVLSPLVVFIPIIFRAGFMPAAAWCLYFLVPCLIGVLISVRRPRLSKAAIDGHIS
jgi:hypothetical protein